jgi:hypothetical protein
MSKPMPRRGWLVLLLLGVVPLAGQIDNQEFACEEAFQHVDECCGRKPSFTCGADCSEVDTSLATADCLRHTSCEDLRASGACENPLGAVCQ